MVYMDTPKIGSLIDNHPYFLCLDRPLLRGIEKERDYNTEKKEAKTKVPTCEEEDAQDTQSKHSSLFLLQTKGSKMRRK